MAEQIIYRQRIVNDLDNYSDNDNLSEQSIPMKTYTELKETQFSDRKEEREKQMKLREVDELKTTK